MKKILLATALVASCSTAMAVEGYAGALIGLSHLNADCTGVASCDNSDTAFKIYGGSEFSPNLSIELGYTSFGTAKSSITPGVAVKIKTHAFSVVAAYRANVTPSLAAVGRLGLASVTATATVVGAGEEDELKVKPYLGIGMDYAIGKNIKIVGALDATTMSISGQRGGIYVVGVGTEVGF